MYTSCSTVRPRPAPSFSLLRCYFAAKTKLEKFCLIAVEGFHIVWIHVHIKKQEEIQFGGGLGRGTLFFDTFFLTSCATPSALLFGFLQMMEIITQDRKEVFVVVSLRLFCCIFSSLLYFTRISIANCCPTKKLFVPHNVVKSKSLEWQFTQFLSRRVSSLCHKRRLDISCDWQWEIFCYGA